MRPSLFALVALLTASVAAAQGVEVAPDPETAAEANREFAGLSFGVGISATLDTGTHDRVSDAGIDANGIVRVSKKDNVRARVMLESHYFFPWKKPDDPTQIFNSSFGPFVALQPGTDEIVDAIELGVMFGFRRSGSRSGESFNLGVGFVVDPSTKILSDEFKENQAAPLGPDGEPIPVRLQERDQGGILVLASFSWD